MIELTHSDSERLYYIFEEFLEEFHLHTIKFNDQIEVIFSKYDLFSYDNSNTSNPMYLITLNYLYIDTIIHINLTFGMLQTLVQNIQEFYSQYPIIFLLTIVFDDDMLRYGMITNGGFIVDINNGQTYIEIDQTAA